MGLLTELFAESEDTTADGKRIHADVLLEADDEPSDSTPPEPPASLSSQPPQ